MKLLKKLLNLLNHRYKANPNNCHLLLSNCERSLRGP